jgi:hypothetical protein
MTILGKTSALLGLALLACSCGGNETILKSGKQTPAAVNTAPAKPPVKKELDAMQTAGFSFIYVLRRKDGGTIDAEDRGVIKLQTADANRRVATEDGLAFVIGTNTALASDKIAALYVRFAVDAYSAEANGAANGNSNTNK